MVRLIAVGICILSLLVDRWMLGVSSVKAWLGSAPDPAGGAYSAPQTP